MIQLEEEELEGKRAILTSDKAFLLRFSNSGFKTKWAGFWVPPTKFMDYYAYKVNGEWLSPDKVNKFSLKSGLGSWSYHLTNLGVKEDLFVSDKGFCSVLDITNRSKNKKAVSICLEAALDFRPKSKDVIDRNYHSEFSQVRSAVKVVDSDSDLTAMYGRAKSGRGEVKWRPEAKYKEHYPGDKQVCYLPGTYSLKVELEGEERLKIPFVFSFSRKGDIRDNFDSLLDHWPKLLSDKRDAENEATKKVKTASKTIDRAFRCCRSSLDDLKFDLSGNERLFAGLPWFQAEWGRDVLWSLLGLIDQGQFEFVESCLRRLSQNREGRIPNKMDLQGNVSYDGADIDPLFLVVLAHYRQVSGKEGFLQKEVQASFDTLNSEEGLIRHEANETWMDTLKRGNSAIEIQSLWLEAAKRYNRSFKDDLQEGLKQYWNQNDNYFFDSFAQGSPMTSITSNPAVALMWGQIEEKKAEKALQVIGSQLTTNYGVRTLSYLEDDYSPQTYHQGASWFLVTLWSAAANLRYGRAEEGVSLLKKAAQDVNRKQIGAISECINAESGELIGCSSQAWSEALLLHVVDNFLLGIKPELQAKALVIDPELPPNWNRAERHQKRIGDVRLDLVLVRKDNKMTIKLDFDQEPEFKLKLPAKGETKINGEATGEANLKQENVVEIVD